MNYSDRKAFIMIVEVNETELKVLKYLINKEVKKQMAEPSPNSKNITGLNNLLGKIEIAEESNRGDNNYDLGFSVNDAEERNIDYVMKASDASIREYASTKGQMSLMPKFDEIKKDSAIVMAMMADLKATLSTNVDFAKDRLKSIYARIVEEIMKESKTSNAVAERRALIDSRYIIAKEQYRVYSRYANMIKYRYDAFRDITQGVIQSVATARVGMIRDSYMDEGGKYTPEV